MDQSPELCSANPLSNAGTISASDLHEALENREFVPYFQPQVNLRAGTIHGFEILARWQRPTLGLISPDAFVPIVESSGLMNRLSASLLTQAFATVRHLPKDFRLSVNLSPSQLHDRSLPDLMHRLADDAEFDLKRLTIELTETALVDDLALASAVAENFKKLGICLSLDDFGTGYSSLLHLQSLPFDELKVDISFVRSMVDSRQSRKITAAVISLGLSLGLRTIAEGVESQSQANLLAWQGCDLGQGYLYGRPIPAHELLGVLSQCHPGVCGTTEVPASITDPFLSLDSHPTERLSQLRAIYDGAPVGLAFVDCNLRYVNLNQRLAQMNHQSVQAHLGRKLSDMVSPAIYAQFEPFLKAAIAGETVEPFELRRPSLGPGEPVMTLLVSYETVRDETGEILGVCISISDISGVKLKEEALRESEDHFRHTVELNPQAPWTMEPDGRITISSRWTTLTGLTQQQTSHGGWLNAVHKDDLELIRKEFEFAIKTGTPMDLELRIRDKNGIWVWVRSQGAPRRNSAGEVVRWYGSVESIDEHKRAADKLRSSEARLRAIFDTVPVGIVLAESSTGKVLDANPMAEQLLGFPVKPGMIWSAGSVEVTDSCGRRIEESNLPLMCAMRSGATSGTEEVLLRRPDRSKIWLSINAAPMNLQNGDLFGGVLVIQDIDARKRESEALLALALDSRLVTSRISHASPDKAA